MRRIVVSLGVFCLVTVSEGVAQEPTAPAPSAFEVASVKPNTSRTTSVTLPEFRGNTFRYANLPPIFLLMEAYGVWKEEVIGVPAWLTTERFDVVATAPAGTTFRQAMSMVRHLFETRFNLRAHRESRELPVYALTIANANGELGSQLRRAEGCLPRAMCEGSRFSDSNASFAIFKARNGRPLWSALPQRLIIASSTARAYRGRLTSICDSSGISPLMGRAPTASTSSLRSDNSSG